MGSSSLSLFLPDRFATERLGYLLGGHLPPNSVILLKGQLGAGKTTLVAGLARGLGIQDTVASPTFTLINEYCQGRIPLYHLDLYRLTPEQVSGIYPEIYWEGEEVTPGITAIEWSERLEYKPESYLEVDLSYDAKKGRQALLNPIGASDLNFSFLKSLRTAGNSN